jgi:hypothetical protein
VLQSFQQLPASLLACFVFPGEVQLMEKWFVSQALGDPTKIGPIAI